MKVPAICDNCGAFFPSGFDMTNCKNITFAGCKSGPCPKCGEEGHVPDGIYNFIGSTIELLSGPKRTVSELEHLATILIKIRNQGASLQQTTQKISEEIPELYSLTQVLPKTRSEF